MDFSLLPEEVDRSMIQQTVIPAIESLNQRFPGSDVFPHLIGFMARASTDPNCRTAVFVNTTTWTVDKVENATDLTEALARLLSSWSPPPVPSTGDGDEKLGPATKESIEAIPVVKVLEPGKECSVCLGEFDVGGNAKEMPCKHVYHSACIDKWLGICGSCPICRYSLPKDGKVDEDGDDDDDDDDDVEVEETAEGEAGGGGDNGH